MNILFQCSEYPPMPSGGIGSVVKIVAEGLVKRGHTVVVTGYYHDFPAFSSYEVQNGVHVYNCGLGNPLPRALRPFRSIFNACHLLGRSTQRALDHYENKMASLVEQYGIDIVEMTDFYQFNFCKSSLKYRRFDVPVVMRFHGPAYYLAANAGKDNALVKKNDLAHFARADCFSYVSSYMRDFVRNMGADCPPRGEAVIHNMVEDAFLSGNIPAAASRTILYFGKLVRTKGAFATAAAFSTFHETHPDWRLVMAGPGDAVPVLAEVSEDARRSIEFPGFCDRERIRQYIDDCAFVCIPSFFEAFGMAPLEAMARSRAVIFTERTSGPEVIENGENGILVNPDDVSMIAEKMSLLADDVSLRDRIARNAFGKIGTELSGSRILDKLEEFYKKLI